MSFQSIFNATQVQEIETIKYVGTVDNGRLKQFWNEIPDPCNFIFAVAGGFAASCAHKYMDNDDFNDSGIAQLIPQCKSDPRDQTEKSITKYGDIDIYMEFALNSSDHETNSIDRHKLMENDSNLQVIETPEVKLSDSTRENLSESQLYLYRVKYGAFIVHLFDINMCQAFMVPNGEMWDIYVTPEFIDGRREKKIQIRGRYQNFLETWNRCIKYANRLVYNLPDSAKLEVLSRGKRNGYNSKQQHLFLKNMAKNLVERMDECYKTSTKDIFIDQDFKEQFEEIPHIPLGHSPDKLKFRLENYTFPEDRYLLMNYTRSIISKLRPEGKCYSDSDRESVRKNIGERKMFDMYMNGNLSESIQLKGFISLISGKSPEDIEIPNQIFSEEFVQDYYAPKCTKFGNMGIVPLIHMHVLVINLDTGYAWIQSCHCQYNHTTLSKNPCPK